MGIIFVNDHQITPLQIDNLYCNKKKTSPIFFVDLAKTTPLFNNKQSTTPPPRKGGSRPVELCEGDAASTVDLPK